MIRSLVTGKDIQTLLIDGEDLILVLEAHLTLRDLIDRKVKAAQTKELGLKATDIQTVVDIGDLVVYLKLTVIDDVLIVSFKEL